MPPAARVTDRLAARRPRKRRRRRPFGPDFDRVFAARIREADEFYRRRIARRPCRSDDRRISRQAYAGLLWSKQFYHYVVRDWLDGDPDLPPPPRARKHGRNDDWRHLFNRDVISMPDKWEYPWFAAWDLAFHMIPFARVDPAFRQGATRSSSSASGTCTPTAQMPAYEFALRRRQSAGPRLGLLARLQNRPARAASATRLFLAARLPEAADQLHLVGQPQGRRRASNLFAGGFLGLDNIGVFDRSKPLPGGGHLEQADGTAWMAFYCVTMLAMALELAHDEAGLRGHRLEVLRALRGHRRRHEHAGRHAAFGTRRTASTTTSSASTAQRIRCGSARWWA